ncbi:hypothetical protein [Roseateles oligotrophus]|uniref:hypothetical protein n=1 Tax=Roseateles oligotrophus TaxID=1769250 RepID=UPI0021E3A1B1|nr:hypothetical protein [Roseateles oligotrophus]
MGRVRMFELQADRGFEQKGQRLLVLRVETAQDGWADVLLPTPTGPVSSNSLGV